MDDTLLLDNAQLLFLLELLCVGGLCRVGFNRLGLVRALAGIDVTFFVVDIGLFAQLSQIGAERGLQLLHVQSVLDSRLNVLHRRNSCHLVAGNLQDDVALLGTDHVGNFAGLHGKCFIFKLLGEGAALERPEIAALRSRGTVGIFLCQIFKAGSSANLFEKIIGLGFGHCQSRSLIRLFGGVLVLRRVNARAGGIGNAVLGRSRGGSLVGRRLLRGDQDFAQFDRLGLFHLVPVLIVKLLLFLLGDAEVGANFFSNYLLGDDPVPHVLLEVFVRNALGGGGLFELLHRIQLHILAHLVEFLDQIGITRNVEVFALLQQELLVDEIAQNVLFTLRIELVRVRRILLLGIIPGLVLAALELRKCNDLAVHARDYF